MAEQCSDLPEHVKPTTQEKVEKKKDGKRHRPVVLKSMMGMLGYKKENEKTGSVQVCTEMGEVLEKRESVHSHSPEWSVGSFFNSLNDEKDLSAVEEFIGTINAEASELEYNVSDIAELKCSLEELEKERDCLLEKNQLLQAETLKLQKDANSQKPEILELQKNLELAKSENEELHERVKSLEVEAHTKAEAVMVKIATLENEKEQLRQKLVDANAELENKTRSMHELKSTCQDNVEFHNTRMKELENKMKETQNTAQVAKKKYEFLQSERQKKEEQFLEYEHKYKQAEEELERFKESHHHCQEDLKKKDAEIGHIKQQLQKKIDELDAESANSQQKIQREHREVFEKERERHQLLLQEKDDVIHRLQVQLGSVNQSNKVPNTDNEPSSLTSQSTDGAGASSLSVESEEIVRLREEVLKKDEKIADLQRELLLKVSESNSTEQIGKSAEVMFECETSCTDHSVVLELKQQLEKKDEEIGELRNNNKSDLAESYEDLKRSTALVSKAIVERENEIKRLSKLIAEMKEENEQYKQALSHQTSEEKATESAAKLALNGRLAELQNKEKEIKELQRQLTNEKMRSKKLSVEFEAAQEDLSHKMQRIVNLTDAVEERKEKIKELEYELEMKAQNLTKSEQDLIAAKQQMKRNVENAEANAMMIDHKEKKIDALTKQLKDAQEDLHAAKTQAAIYEEELKKTMTDLKKEKNANAQLQNVLERDQRIINGLKEEKKSLEAVRISYEEIRDAQKNWEEEKKGSEQQIRAYKRQVDSLSDQFRLKQQELQATLDKMKGVEFKNNELHSKCHELNMRIATQERTNTRSSYECEKCGNWGKEKQRTDGEMVQLRSANQMLQQRLRSAWDDIKDQQQSHLLQIQQLHMYYQSKPQHPQSHNVVVPVQSSSDEVHSRGTPAVVAITPSQSHVSVDERSKQADIALQKADEARQELEAKRRTQSQLVGKDQMYQSHSGMVQGHNSKKNQFEETAVEIEENRLLHGIDNEIQNFADDVRKQSKPPPTQEFDEDDASLHIPFDPYLQCQGCGMQFRVGEIQKLKRHINEFCRAPNTHRI